MLLKFWIKSVSSFSLLFFVKFNCCLFLIGFVASFKIIFDIIRILGDNGGDGGAKDWIIKSGFLLLLFSKFKV